MAVLAAIGASSYLNLDQGDLDQDTAIQAKRPAPTARSSGPDRGKEPGRPGPSSIPREFCLGPRPDRVQKLASKEVRASAVPPLTDEDCCVSWPLRLKATSTTERPPMAHNYAINDDVHHQLQGPQGRAVIKQRSVYTIVTCLPIESDGRPRYRIKSKTENVERVVTEEQISRLG